MVATAPLKKSHYMKEWKAQAEKASAIKKWMASRYSSLQIKWHTTLKKGWLQVVIWEKI